jgi:hypothetical protein
MKAPMLLTGDQIIPAMPLTDAKVNHLRRLLAWMRVEYMLDEDAQRGFLKATTDLLQLGTISQDVAQRAAEEKAARINGVPAYVRQGVKMLTKALREHDRRSGIVDSEDGR